MKDRDALVEALGRELRKTPGAGDPRWAELGAGELSPEATAALVEASPLDDAAREQALLDRALAPRPPPALPRSWRGALGGRGALAFALAAAFALVLAVLVLPRPGPPERTPPTCALEARGDAAVLGPDAGPGELVVSVGTRVHLALTPTSPVSEDLVARFFLVSGGDARALAFRPPPGPAVRIDGLREELFPGAPAGRYELVVLVACAGTAADEAALAAMALDPGRAAPGWRALRRPVELRGSPEEPAVPVPRAVGSMRRPMPLAAPPPLRRDP